MSEAPLENPAYTFVSMPDWLNADIGDLRQLDTWRPGFGNSTNDKYRRATRIVLDDIAARDPDSVLVAGDLVEGHWGADVEKTGFFGPVNTIKQRRQQIRNAGHFYYGEWAKRFAARDLTVYPAVGDHEIGDNPWSGTGCYGSGCDFKRNAFPVFKQTWADVFGDVRGFVSRPTGTSVESTAYAVRVAPEVLVVTVDVFSRSGGDVRARLSNDQLAWLDRLLTDTNADTVIVQGHTPVLWPVRHRKSSQLYYEGAKESPFWQTLVEHGVDLYLCGEVHDVTALSDSGVTQISHGGLINWGGINHLTGRVYSDRIELELNRFTADVADPILLRLWATTWKRPNADVTFQASATTTGTMTIRDRGITAATGELTPWDGVT
ncbi:MAG TPA: metallophosphoesterase [Nocardioidaceae bacterium]|nr:metallophosphoesterase [Nocardioidaceae bacterium]